MKMFSALKVTFQEHDFLRSGIDLPKGLLDVPLFGQVADLGCEVFITGDIRQLDLDRVDERDACRDAGLHWVGVPKVPAKGKRAMTADAAVIIGALLHIIDDIATSNVPRCYLLEKGPLDLAGAVNYATDL